MKQAVVFLALALLFSSSAFAVPADQADGHFASFDGTEIHWQSWTVEDPLAVIVLVHGYGSSSDLFTSFVEDLNAEGISAYAPDLRGHGSSGGKEQSVESFDDYVRDLEGFVDIVMQQEGTDKVFLLGQSLGGDIVLRYSMEHPEDLKGLVVMGPGVGMQLFGRSIPLSVIRLIYPLLRIVGRLLPGFSVPVPGINKNMNMKMLAENAGNVFYLWENVDRITVPCLFVMGSDDQVVPQEVLRAFYDAVPSADKSFSVVEGADHFLFKEQSVGNTADAVVGWLLEHYECQCSEGECQCSAESAENRSAP